MALHGFYSAYPNQRFQPGCSGDMLQFFEHEAWTESDDVAKELDILIARGAVPHIHRIDAAELEAEAAKAMANAAALQAKAAAAAKANAGAVTHMTTTVNMGMAMADSLAEVAPVAAVKK